jgi:SAM-dependent methyltransferase
MAGNSTTRFSNRVEDYVKYRPGYPAAVVDFLEREYGLSSDKLIADIGSGTGISAALFLNAGYRVIAVEPNQEMRARSVELLGALPGFSAHNGTAEHTGLQAGSVDAVIAGQAFHWFDAEKAKAEFKRILKPGGLVGLIWNERKTESAFEKEYDDLIRKHAHDYVEVRHRNIAPENIAAFFSPQPVHLEVFDNRQVLDYTALEGRLLSSSYSPARNSSGYDAMISDLKALFNKHRQQGVITLQYDTKVYVGLL